MTSMQFPAPIQRGLLPGTAERPVVLAQLSQYLVVDVNSEVGQSNQAKGEVSPRLEIGGCRG